MMKKKLETSDTKEDRDKSKESTSTTQREAPIDPEMPPLQRQDQSSLNLRSQHPPRNITKRSDRSTRPSRLFLPNSIYLFIFHW